MKRITFLLLGTNEGDRKKHLDFARNAIAMSVGPVLKASSVYQTAAWGKTDQPDFLNQALQVETVLPAEEVLEAILNIEHALGRKREEKWGVRSMDIDILLYGDEIHHSPRLNVPHPELPRRRFALEPLTEIAGEIIHPTSNQKIREMLEACTDPLPVQRLVE